jgi:N-acetylglutamate synthase-like GNAT family acetyltransferase
VRRSREQLEMEIDKFTIIQRDNTTIACAVDGRPTDLLRALHDDLGADAVA